MNLGAKNCRSLFQKLFLLLIHRVFNHLPEIASLPEALEIASTQSGQAAVNRDSVTILQEDGREQLSHSFSHLNTQAENTSDKCTDDNFQENMSLLTATNQVVEATRVTIDIQKE